MIKLPRLDRAWRPAKAVVLFGLIILLAIIFLTWHIGTSPNGSSPAEAAAKSSSNLTALSHQPFFAPWRLTQDVLMHTHKNSRTFARLPSVIFSLIFLVTFYLFLKSLFGKAIAFLCVALLATTPLFLLAARNGTPDILYFFPIVVIYAYTLINKPEPRAASLALFVIIIAAALYVPGLVWFLLAAGIWKWRQIWKLFSLSNWYKTSLVVLAGLVLISPLIFELARQPHLIRSFLLIPDHFGKLLSVLKNWAWMVAALILRAPQNETFNLGRLPVLDVAQIALLIFGAYVMVTRLRAEVYWAAGLVLLTTLLDGLNNSYTFLAVALTFISIVIGLGMRYLFIEWMHVFPRNPLARYFAIILIGGLVLAHVIYGLRYGLVAWPHAAAITNLYVLK